jgi:hypothetical protein
MTLKFDQDKSFDENIAEFRKHLDGIDPDCAKILFEHISVLEGDGNPERAREYRTAFNETVLKSLEQLRAKSSG